MSAKLLTQVGLLIKEAQELQMLLIARKAQTMLKTHQASETAKMSIDSRTYQQRLEDIKKWQSK